MEHQLKLMALICAAFLFAGATPASAQTHLEEYKLYMTALEEGDAAKAEHHAEAAWRAAESELGDDRLTAILAYNYALLIYYAKMETATTPLERVVALIDAGISDIDPDEPTLMLAYAEAVTNSDDLALLKNLTIVLESQAEAGVDPSPLSCAAWLHVAGANLKRKRYRDALNATKNAEQHLKIALPQETKYQGTALIMQTAAYILPRGRSKSDFQNAHDAIYRAIYLFPPQEDIDSFDMEFATALVWHHVIHGLAASEEVETGTRLGQINLDDDNPVEFKMWRDPDRRENCDVEWLKRNPPDYPGGAASRGYVGGAMIGYNIGADLRPADVRIISEVPYSSQFGKAALESIKNYKLAKDPGPAGCKSDYVTFFTFQFQ